MQRRRGARVDQEPCVHGPGALVHRPCARAGQQLLDDWEAAGRELLVDGQTARGVAQQRGGPFRGAAAIQRADSERGLQQRQQSDADVQCCFRCGHTDLCELGERVLHPVLVRPDGRDDAPEERVDDDARVPAGVGQLLGRAAGPADVGGGGHHSRVLPERHGAREVHRIAEGQPAGRGRAAGIVAPPHDLQGRGRKGWGENLPKNEQFHQTRPAADGPPAHFVLLPPVRVLGEEEDRPAHAPGGVGQSHGSPVPACRDHAPSHSRGGEVEHGERAHVRRGIGAVGGRRVSEVGRRGEGRQRRSIQDSSRRGQTGCRPWRGGRSRGRAGGRPRLLLIVPRRQPGRGDLRCGGQSSSEREGRRTGSQASCAARCIRVGTDSRN